MNVLLVGEEAAGIQTLRALAQSRHRVVAVMSSPTRKTLGGATLGNVAEKLGYRTWPAQLVKDPLLAPRIVAEKVDLLLNVHSLFIIHDAVLSAPRIGSFNLHPGPLPRYAGLNAVSWALYRGETTHGVTIHRMVPKIDAGPIVYQSLFNIEETDTALSLSSKCVTEGLKLVLRLLETASRNPEAIPLVPQDLTQREYFGREVPEDGRLSWDCPGRAILNFVRACDYFPFPSPWGHPRASLGDEEIAIVKASLPGQACGNVSPGRVGHSHASGVNVASADEWITVRQLMVSGRHVSAAEVLKPGMQLNGGFPRRKGLFRQHEAQTH